MSKRLKGQKHEHRSASTRPDVAAKIQSWWTPERREAKRQQMLERNPAARYHGLSAKEAAKIVRSVGYCQRCLGDGSESRLGIHHKDRNKQNQRPSNLEVLCHCCHMQEHRNEIGWAAYHAKRKSV